MNLDQLNDILEGYLKNEIPGKYKNGEYPFYDEDDIVSDVHNHFMQYHNSEGIKIFREFPVDLIAPLRLTPATFTKLEQEYPIRNYYDSIARSGYHNLICEIETIIAENPFENANRNIKGEYIRNYEPKYFDLVIIDDYPETKQDELIRPKIVMEFKYEAAKSRKENPGDIRRGITLPKNDGSAIKHDLDALKLYCKSNPGAIGYFIFIDEEDGINANKFISNLLPEEQIHLSELNKGVIAIRTFKYLSND